MDESTKVSITKARVGPREENHLVPDKVDTMRGRQHGRRFVSDQGQELNRFFDPNVRLVWATQECFLNLAHQFWILGCPLARQRPWNQVTRNGCIHFQNFRTSLLQDEFIGNQSRPRVRQLFEAWLATRHLPNGFYRTASPSMRKIAKCPEPSGYLYSWILNLPSTVTGRVTKSVVLPGTISMMTQS